MQLGLKRRIAKTFKQIFVGGVGDTAWRVQNSTVVEDVTGGLDVSHTVFINSQSHSAEQGFQTFLLPCTPSAFPQMSMYPFSIPIDEHVPLQHSDR